MGLEESIAQLVCNTYGSLQRGRTDNSFASSRSSCERSQHCDCGGKEGKGDRKVYWYDTVFIGPHFFTWPKRGKRIPFLSFRVLRSVTVQVHRVVFFGNFFSTLARPWLVPLRTFALISTIYLKQYVATNPWLLFSMPLMVYLFYSSILLRDIDRCTKTVFCVPMMIPLLETAYPYTDVRSEATRP